MTVETGLPSGVSGSGEVEIEENELNSASMEDQEKDVEVSREIVSDTEEKSDGEVKESSYVFITKENDSTRGLTGDIEGNRDSGEESVNLDENEKTADGLESGEEEISNQGSEVMVSENCDDGLVQEDLELEIDACPVNNTQLGVESRGCSSELTEGESERKKDGDSSYVFVDMVSNEPTEISHFVVDSKFSDFHQPVIVGSVICGMHQISVSGSHCYRDIAKSETEAENSSSDRHAHPAILTEAAGMNEFDTIESVNPVENAYLESEVGSIPSLRNTNSTVSSSSYNSDEKVDEKMEKRPIFRYLIKVPRYFDDTIKQQIDFFQQQVDEETRLRDAVRANVVKQKASCNEFRDIYEASKSGTRAAYDALYHKRQEIDSVQSVLNRINNAISIEEIDYKIRNIQHTLEHETISLKEEKQLLREMKQLRLYYQQLCSSFDNQAEGQPTFDQKEGLEERLKLLKRDLDSARKEIVRTEGIADSARKMYFDENEKLRNMQSQFESANALRQEAYAHVLKLKKQLYDKNKYFRMYKDDARKAENYGFSGDREALHSHCVNQVENIMELWNKNDDFRNNYIRCNTVSTVRRLGTLDGRSLGPEDYPPLLQKIGDSNFTVSPAVSTEMNPRLPVPTPEQVLTLVPESTENESAVKEKQKTQMAQSNEAILSISNNGSATVYDEMEVGKKTAAVNKQTKEEHATANEEMEVDMKTIAKNEQIWENEEPAIKEVLVKEAAAGKIREHNLLEEKAKVKEAEERKRRNAEKAQARAELKAQKEAEHKEKERAKRQRRKARKNELKGITEPEPSGLHSESTLHDSTLAGELEIEVNPKTTATRTLRSETGEKHTKTASKRSSLSAKRTRAVPPPPSLLSKNKKRMQPWLRNLLVALVAVLAAVIFLGILGQMAQ